MTHLSPDLAFRVLKHLSVKELLKIELVNINFYIYNTSFFPSSSSHIVKLGFTQMASYGSSSFYLEVSLSKHNRH